MFKTGSKFLLGLAAFGFVAAGLLAFGSSQHKWGMDAILGPLTLGWKGYVGDHVGYTVLFGLGVAALFGGAVLALLGDADAEESARALDLDTVPEVAVPVTGSYWPVVGAFSVAAIALGLAVGPILFVIGLVGVSITLVEWAVRAWADRVTGDPAVNATIRNRLMNPLEIPLGAALVVAGIVLAVSRMLLALPKGGAYVIFGALPALLLLIGLLIALRPKLSQSVIAVILIVVGLAVLGGGVVAGIHGEREHEEEHEEHDEGEGAAPLPAPAHTVIRIGA